MIRLLTIALLLIPALSWAVPVRVTLFPTSALVEETGRVASASNKEGSLTQEDLRVLEVIPSAEKDGFSSVILTLPGQANPATLRFGRLPAGTAIADLTWIMRQEQNQTALATLNTRLAELKTQRNAILAEQDGIRGRMAFWQAQTEPVQQSVTALRELAAEVGSTLRADSGKLRDLDQKLTDVNTRIATTENEIAQAAGQDRSVWDVTVLFTGQPPKELTYDYTLSDCGWTPLYRLEAKPKERSIDFSWQAKVWQRSGQDWTKVILHLATMPPDSQSAPGDLPPWEIRPLEIYHKAAGAPTMMAMRAESLDVAEAPAPMPEEVRHTTYAAWDMGQRALPAGETRVFEIRRETWPATFIHLLRPSLDSKAYVQATASFDQPKDLPLGSAFFLIDGATVDQREFSLSGKEATMFFGADPLLTCETTLYEKKTGDKGLFKQKQTFVRQWAMTIRNASAHHLQYRLEEPKPLPRDERITLDLAATPAPLQEEKPEILAWNGTVNAGSAQTVSLTLTFEAPEDLALDPGWRW